MYGTNHDKYLRDSYGMYVESYDTKLDYLPPLTWDAWLNAYGPSLIREGLVLGLITK